jgi:hypothetical protein
MRRSSPADPPRWTLEQLEADRELALAAFVAERGREGTEAYRAAFLANRPVVQRLFELTADLREFGGQLFQSEPNLLAAARYLGGPPVSKDDLDTLVGAKLGRRLDAVLAQRVADVVRSAWDPVRFPWLVASRRPARHEREAAINWTAGIWAVEKLRTLRRTESSRRQEAAVAAALREAAYQQAPRIRLIRTLDEIARGTFCPEAIVAGSKCDVPVRMRDGRLLALECKVSNSSINSVKRLNRETGDKARNWRSAFGRQVITGAVLAGVYKLGNLISAQDDPGIVIFWEHDLAPLRDFVSESA